MYLKYILSFFASILSISSILYYIYSILNNQTKPHIISWIIWVMSVLSIFIAQFLNHGGIGSLGTFVHAVMMFLVVILCFYKKIQISFHKIDYISLFLATFALFLWYIISNTLIAVILMTFVDIIGYIPTFRKIYNNPFEENLLVFNISTLRNILIIMSMQHYSIITIIFPITICVANTILVFFAIIRKLKFKQLIYC